MQRPERFVVRVGGDTFDVLVHPNEDAITSRVEVDGVMSFVRSVGDGVFAVESSTDRQQRDVLLEKAPRARSGSVLGHAFEIDVETEQEALARRADERRGGSAHQGSITRAPMPGRIVRVLVTEGDAVEVNAPLIIIEAMKMENELRSTLAGTVARIAVAEGDAVESGQVLCELTPHAASD